MKSVLLLFAVIILQINISIAQIDNINLDKIIEELTEDAPDDKKQSLTIELYEIADNPVNINTDDIEQLSLLYILKPEIIKNIKNYINKNGYISSIFELKLIKGINIELIRLLSPFISFSNPHKKVISNISNVKHNILLNASVTKKESKQNTNYLGNNWRHTLRYNIKIGKQIQAGILGEKDPGEEFFANSQKSGFDFYSSYLQINPSSKLTQINLGDFKVNWGQGLVTWNGFTTGKSSYSIIRGNYSSSLKKYNSTEENRFFRGISINYSLTEKINITPFYSSKKRDAKIIEKEVRSDIGTTGSSSSYLIDTTVMADFINTGYHRTKNELENKNTATENVYGMRIHLCTKRINIGLNYLKSSTTPSISPSTGYWQTYFFFGKYNYNLSLDYKFTLKKIYFFGESAISKNSASAHLLGANFYPFNSLEFSIIYRKYAKAYQADYAGAFGEFSNTQNEEGIYTGIELQPLKDTKINAYFDYFKFPYKRYCINTSGSGIEYLINIEYCFSKDIHMYCKYKYEKKPRNYKVEKATIIPNNIKQSFRYHISIKSSDQCELRSRIELNKYKHKDINDHGLLVFQDILYNINNSTIKTQLRFALFKTDSYNSRIYVYENDLYYSFYSPALYYKGFRTFFNTKIKISKFIFLNCKYAFSNYKNINIDEAKSQKKTEFKIQVKIKI